MPAANEEQYLPCTILPFTVSDRSLFVLNVIIIMDGSCTAQIFPSRKPDALTHTIHANVHADINIIHTHTGVHTHTMIHLHLWKCLLKRESFELGFEVREGGEIPQVGRQ